MLDIAQYTQKYQTMTRALSRGAKDGRANLPPPAETRLSQAELEIVQLAQTDLAKLSDKQKKENDEAWEEIRECRSELLKEVLPKVQSFRARAELKLNEADHELLRLYENLLSREQEYRYFRTINRLNRDADVPSSLFFAASILIFLIVVDGAVNMYFFKDAYPTALVGGFLFAGLISLGNTVIGVAAGLVPFRYLQHTKRLHVVWAFPLLAAMFVTIGAFNLAVGHYRDLLAVDKDALFINAIAVFKAAPFGLQSIQSFLLSGFGIAIAMIAAREGYVLFDSYPGYGRYYKRRENARDLFEARYMEVQREVGALAKEFLDDVKKHYQRANTLTQGGIATIQNTKTRNETYAEMFDGIEKGCNAAIRTYRDANIQVRDSARYPAPPYFSQPASLTMQRHTSDSQMLDLASQEFTAIQARNESEFDALCQAVPAEALSMLSEAALNDRLEQIKLVARESMRRDEKS